uniref:Calcineurin-like EF-hand protein 2 n=1 Tax=Xiphophorus maculatus TaxID=8083 RepID=A0A3B5QVW3_XIPMA
SVSAAHLLRLHQRFQLLDKDSSGSLRSEDLEAALSENPIGVRIVGAFFQLGQEMVDFPSFVRILAHFRPTEKNRTGDGVQPDPGTQMKCPSSVAFQLYDRDRDGKISRTELLQVLREMLGLQVTEEQLQSIAERAIQEANLDRDDTICFDEFRKSLEKVNINHKLSVRFLE